MIYYDIEQGSQEWHELKMGKASASHIHEIMATVKSGEAATRRNYKMRLVTEILTGQPEQTYQSYDMELGVEREASARLAYEFVKGVSVAQVGFIMHPLLADYGCSPDGLVEGEGMVEIKCPKPATHIMDYLLPEEIPRNYMLQMQAQMGCADRIWCDFVSYNPDLPVNLQMWIKRVDRDQEMIDEIQDAVKVFMDEVNELVTELRRR